MSNLIIGTNISSRLFGTLTDVLNVVLKTTSKMLIYKISLEIVVSAIQILTKFQIRK